MNLLRIKKYSVIINHPFELKDVYISYMFTKLRGASFFRIGGGHYHFRKSKGRLM